MALCLGSAAGKSQEFRTFSVGDSPRLLSQQKSQWHGQKASVFLFQQKPSQDNESAPTLHTKIYVAPSTNLVIGKQEFAFFKNGTSRLASELSIDYTSPNASLFDLSRLKQGAKIIKQLPPRR